MDYEKAYKDALERARELSKTTTGAKYEYIFPELKVSEDERIRESLIELFKDMEWDDSILHDYDMDKDKTIAWLEKQGELVNETITIPDGCVATIEDNKIHIKREGKSAIETIKEEKVDNANMVEPKFKVGDWVVRKDGGVFFTDRKFAQITEIDGEKHWFDTGLIWLKAEDMRLWTIDDAEDGDILYSKKHNLLWRYKNTKECYYCINLNYSDNNISYGSIIVMPNDVRPATKEQRDLLFDKMLRHIMSEINGKKELIRRI